MLGFDWGDGGIRDHIAIYLGGGMMISGNDHNNSVGIARVPTGNLVGIIRPRAFEGARASSSGGGFDPLGAAGDVAAGAAGLAGDAVGLVGGAAGDVASDVVSGITDMLAEHAAAFMLNIALIGGGAFLIYYGAALLLGVQSPGAKLAGAGALAAKGPMS